MQIDFIFMLIYINCIFVHQNSLVCKVCKVQLQSFYCILHIAYFQLLEHIMDFEKLQFYDCSNFYPQLLTFHFQNYNVICYYEKRKRREKIHAFKVQLTDILTLLALTLSLVLLLHHLQNFPNRNPIP